MCFSYYMNNAMARGGAWPPGPGNGAPPFCQVDPNATAAFLLNATARASIDAWAAHYVSLARRLGKPPPHLTAGAPCTHAPEGTGWGAVDAWAGALWYADALGRLARGGVGVFARQTLFGGDYGLLDNSMYLPTPGYWIALLHKRLMGRKVLDVTGVDGEGGGEGGGLTVYAHCARGRAGGVALLAANLGRAPASLVLPPATATATAAHDTRVEVYLLDGGPGGGVLGKTPRLNGVALAAGADGVLPPLEPAAGASPLAVPGFAVLFAVVDGTAAGAKECAAG